MEQPEYTNAELNAELDPDTDRRAADAAVRAFPSIPGYQPTLPVSCLTDQEAAHIDGLMALALQMGSYAHFGTIIVHHLEQESNCELCRGAIIALALARYNQKGGKI